MLQKKINQKINLISVEDSSIPFPTTLLELGHSGFRDFSEKIPKAAYRVGLYVGSSIASSKTPKYYVIMITASHNPKQYNGIKVSNDEGLSLSDEESKTIQRFVNNKEQSWNSFIQSHEQGHADSRVFLGMDKRQSSPELYNLVEKALKHFNVHILHFNHVTTPTLYSYCYSYINHTNQIQKGFTSQQISKTYLQCSFSRFKEAASIVNWSDKPNITLDCANGAVGVQIRDYVSMLEQYFDINILNAQNYSQPNFQCGSDYVSSMRLLPLGILVLSSQKFVSFDGDGDRIVVYFQKSSQQPLLLFDGDRLNSIMIKTLSDLLAKISVDYDLNFKTGCICTLTSNKGFVEYVESLNIPLTICKVGIKYLFEEIKHYDIGSLFESSGHGSLFVSQQMYQKLQQIKNKTQQLRLLLCLLDLCNNNSRGDGFKDFLVLQLCQKYLNLNNSELILYNQYHSISLNIHIPHIDQLKFRTNSSQVVQPLEIAQFLKQLNQKYPQISMLLRKSSTQKNLLRVKLESKNADQSLLKDILGLISQKISLHKQLN